MNVVQFRGQLLAGPPSSSTDDFPSGVVSIPFDLSPANKPAEVSFKTTRQVASPGSFAVMSGVGGGEDVAQGTFLYGRTRGPMLLRLTTAGSPDVVAVVPVSGLFAMEFPVGNYLKLLEAEGTGVLEYFVSGNQ